LRTDLKRLNVFGAWGAGDASEKGLVMAGAVEARLQEWLAATAGPS